MSDELIRETITPTDRNHWLELRSQDITSTEISALFNISPYSTHLEVWHKHKNNFKVEFEETERVKWGSRLEDAIARGIGEDNSFPVSPFKTYMRIPSLRAGSSFDYLAGESLETILEIKNVDSLQFKDKWIVEDGKVIEAPPHIELQVQYQLFVSGKKNAYIGALVGGNSVTLLKREIDPEIIESIKKKLEKFWVSIDQNNPPPPVFPQDAEFISKLYQKVDSGKDIEDYSYDLAVLIDKYKIASAKEKLASEEKDTLKAKILMQIRDAEKVRGEDFTITAGVTAACQMNYLRKEFRSFRVHYKKDKK